MKKYLVPAILGLSLALPVLSQSAQPESFEEKISYSMGFEVGNYFKSAGGDIQEKYLILGIQDAYKGDTPQMTPEEMLAVKKQFAQKMKEKQQADLAAMQVKNKAAGEAYLETNKKKEGVIVTESGLQYQVIKEGEGDTAKATDEVTVEYVGTLIDGTEFDSTVKRGEPAVFKVNQVIKGWTEALQLMKVGSKLHLVIPSELGYGENGAAPTIQPNSVLIFDVELKGIKTP